MKHAHTVITENEDLIMPFKKWLSYQLDPREILFNVSAIDGSDFHQPFPIGVAVFLVDAIHPDPAYFYQSGAGVNLDPDGRYLVNSIFSINTTHYVGNMREKYAEQLESVPHVFSRHRPNNDRLGPVETIAWYRQTPFTASPRGNGLDCHRTYEAILFGSIPIIAGADETLKKKYEHLPVWFLDNYRFLSDIKRVSDKRAEIMETTYNFNLLTRTYWENRRPDIDLLMQSVYWLKRFGKFEHVQRYFRESDKNAIDRINPLRYPHPVSPATFKDYWR